MTYENPSDAHLGVPHLNSSFDLSPNLPYSSSIMSFNIKDMVDSSIIQDISTDLDPN